MKKLSLAIFLCVVTISLFSEEPIRYVPGGGKNPIFQFQDQEYRVDIWLGRGYLKLIKAIEYDLAPDIPMDLVLLIEDYRQRVRLGQTFRLASASLSITAVVFTIMDLFGYQIGPPWFDLAVFGGSIGLFLPGMLISNQPPTHVIMYYNEKYGD